MKARVGFTLVSAVLFAAACSGDGTGPGNSQITPTQVALSFTSGAGAGGSASLQPLFSQAAVADTIAQGADTIVFSSVEIVLRDIKLKRVGVFQCDTTAVASSSDDDEMEFEDCEEFKTGPILLSLPLNGAVSQEVVIPIDSGTFSEIEFKVHKPGDDSADVAFTQLHPTFDKTSIRATGTFNGQAFTYETDLDVEQEIDLVPPLVIDAMTTSTNVTIQVNLSDWFRDLSGGLVDPSTGNKGGANEGLVKENIKRSMKGFEDRDRDGVDEEGED